MAAARSRSRAATRAAPAPRERSSSRARASPAAANPAAVIPSKASGRKAAAATGQMLGCPQFLKDIDFKDVVQRLVTGYIPAWLILFGIEKYNLVGKHVSPCCAKMHGEKGQVFAVLGMAHLMFFLLPLFAPLANCSRLITGAAHRAEMAIAKVREQFGTVSTAVVAAFVMQVPSGVTFTWVFTWLAFSCLYFLAMLRNHEPCIRLCSITATFALTHLHYAFIKLKLIK